MQYMVRFLLRAHTHIHICTTPTIIYIQLLTRIAKNMDWTVYKGFTDVKLLIICYSDACLSNIYALKYALTTAAQRSNRNRALVHECGHSEGTPGRQRVKTINILSSKTFERNEQKQVRAYPYVSSWLTTGFVPVT